MLLFTMAHPFPAESVEEQYRVVREFVQVNPRATNPFMRAFSLMDFLERHRYGFLGNLSSGNYAPWPHEAYIDKNVERNCTTIIPNAYLLMEASGIPCRIVQFINFQDEVKGEDKEKTKVPPNESHFALFADVGRRHPYLVDPFWNVFGPLLEQQEHSIRIGKTFGYKPRTRTFSQMIEYTPEEFAAMMERLKIPGNSLEMLMAGQKVFADRRVHTADCSVMVYYNEQNVLSTRLYIPQVALSDKAIYCEMIMGTEGDAQDVVLHLYTAKNKGWKWLVDETKIAQTDFRELRRLQKLFRGIGSKEQRVTLGLQQSPERREKLDALVEEFFSRLTPQEQEKIQLPLLARTLYEHERPEQEYLFSQEERDERFIHLLYEDDSLSEELRPIETQLYLNKREIKRLPANEIKKLCRRETHLKKRIKDIRKEDNELGDLRRFRRKVYDRTMDKVLFAKTLQGKSAADLQEMVRERGFDWLVGYLAMIAEFVPFALKGEQDLRLSLFQDSLREKIRDRYSAVDSLPHYTTPTEHLA